MGAGSEMIGLCLHSRSLPCLVCMEDHDKGMLSVCFSSENRDLHTLNNSNRRTQLFFTPPPMNCNHHHQPTTFLSGLGSTFKVHFSEGDHCHFGSHTHSTLCGTRRLQSPQLILFGHENKNNITSSKRGQVPVETRFCPADPIRSDPIGASLPSLDPESCRLHSK